MERSLSSLEFEIDSHPPSKTHKNSRCTTCGKEYEIPLFTMLSSDHLLDEYYACPKCLSKVGDIESNKTIAVDKTEDGDNEFREMEVEGKKEEAATCKHHLGYLKQRPKNTPIPEECLTCAKTIDCISY